MHQLLATKILWDTDNDSTINLPETIKIPQGITKEDEISEYITEQTGFCHNGFTIIKS